MKKIILNVCLIFAFFTLLGGCASTKAADGQTQILESGVEINAKDDSFQIYSTSFQDDFREGEKFIFIRLYYPTYYNKMNAVNLLKGLIALTEPNTEKASHSSVGFDLRDSFYGLTRYNKNNLAQESCVNTDSNKYSKKCDPYESCQMTLALKVTPEEQRAVMQTIQRDYAAGDIKYNSVQNLPIGFFSMKRKRQKSAEQRALGGIPAKKGYADLSVPEKKFVCSSYIAYVLANNIEEIRDFFIEKQIDYHYVLPSDLFYLPGVQRLFDSTWIDYEIAAAEFVKSEPLFAEYLPE